MWINKSHLIAVGVEPKVAAYYIRMLSRMGPSKTLLVPRKSGRSGAISILHFDLDYAISICRGMGSKCTSNILTRDWSALREALERIERIEEEL